MIPGVQVSATYSSSTTFARAGMPLAIVAPADDGPLVPTMITDDASPFAIFGGGPLAFWAAWVVKNFRLPVLACRALATAVSAFSAVTRSEGHGSSVVTVHAGSGTDVNALVRVWVTTGCTIGVAGGHYRVSLNGGLTYGADTALGTDTSILIDLGTHDLTLDLGAGTLITGELIEVSASVVAAGTRATLDTTYYPLGTNTATASWDTNTYPDDDYDVVIEFPVGGTLGTNGIQYRVSTSGALRDGDFGTIQALGTALSVTVPGTGGQAVTLGTNGQTIGNGAVIRGRTYAPNFNTASVQTAVNALFDSAIEWEFCALAGAMDATIATAVETIFRARFARMLNGERVWGGNMRTPQLNESEATYFSAGQTLASLARTCYMGGIGYGVARAVSPDTGWLRHRPIIVPVLADMALTTFEVDTAATNRPGLPVLLYADDGSPDCHDEARYSGPDDYGFITLIKQPEGVYVTNPRLFAPANAMVEMYPHARALNAHTRLVRGALRSLQSRPLIADKKTGRISEDAASRIETQVNTLVEQNMGSRISGQQVTVNRTDNLTATRPARLRASGSLVTAVYPKVIEYQTEVTATVVEAG